MPADATPNTKTVRDTYISSSNPATKYGGVQELWVSDKQTSFFYCNLPTLPSNANITEARLYFTFKYHINTGMMSVGAYPVNFSWQEHELNWVQANSHDNLGLGTNCLGTVSLNGTTTQTRTSLAITDEVRLWYMSDLKPNFGIAIKRQTGSNYSVILLPREAGSDVGPYFVINYTLQSLPIEDGTYYLRNGQFTRLFMRKSKSSTDWDDNTGVSSGDKYCELFPLNENDSSASAKWVFEYLHNGYYIIKNDTESDCLAIREGNANVGNTILIREPFTGENRQQWKVTLLPNGAYKIKPRSSESYSTDWVMGVRNIDSTMGHNAIQIAFNSADDVLTDQWYIQPMNPTPRISLEASIYYDNLTANNISNVANYLSSNFQSASEWFLTMYGIEIKIRYISLDSTIAVGSGCHVANNNNAICTPDCGPLNQCRTTHHKSASNFYTQGISHSNRICRVVGFVMCGTPSGIHDPVLGITAHQGNEELAVTTQTPNGLNNDLPSTIQHELSHTFGTDDHNQISDEKCVMTSDLGYWCNDCYKAINNYVDYVIRNAGGNAS